VKRAGSLLLPLALLALLLLAAARDGGPALLFEHQFIYFPSREVVGTPADLGLPFEEARFGPGGQLHGWFIPGSSPVTFLWFHGNAGNVSHRLDWLRELRSRLGVSLFIFDYQGYGLSGGQPSEESTYGDARAALAYLRSRPDVDAERIVYFGKSLGGAVAIQLATEQPPYRVIAQSTFTSLLDIGRLHYPFLPVSAILRTRYASIEKIDQVKAPLLVVHGADDDVVPLAQAQHIFEAAVEPKRLFVVEAAGHNDVIPLGGEPYFQLLREFCGLDERPQITSLDQYG
jgi:fermentation-respiration switch protein FrsA (DUF1100 family)